MRKAALVSLAVAAAVLATALATGPRAQGQAAGPPLLTVGIDVMTASKSEVTYAIEVANAGSGPASGVTATSAVPANTTFKTSNRPTSASCHDDGNGTTTETCAWALGTLPSGASATIEATYNLVHQTNSYTVSLSATGSNGDGQSSASDTDSALRRETVVSVHDTFVDDTDVLAGAEHGRCRVMRVRGDGSATGFVRYFGIFLGAGSGSPTAIERLYGAEIRAKAAEAGSATTIGAHRIETTWLAGDSDANSSTCPGAAGTGDQPRKGWRPPSAASPTSYASFAGVTGGDVVWDVTSDLDTPSERSDGKGWELISTAGGTDQAVLHSNDAVAAADKLNIYIVYTAPEPPTCLQVQPSSQGTGSYHEAVLTAHLTDGVKVSSTDRDACTGGPAAGHAVDWSISDDVPDSYISSRNGVPASQRLNGTHTAADAAGEATIGLRLAAPGAGTSGDAGNTSVTAKIEDPDDPNGTNQDSGVVAWTWEPPPPEPAGGSTTEPGSDGTPGTPPPTLGTDTDTGTGTGTAAAARTIRAAAARRRVSWGGTGTIRGRIASSEAACTGRQKVELHRRANSARLWQPVARRSTDATGRFSFEVLVKRSAQYAAVASATADCADAVSAPTGIVARIAVTVRSRRTLVTSARRARIFGRALPASAGKRAILERKAGKRWVRVARKRLGRRGRYAFAPRVGWSGPRAFRVRVPSRSSAYAAGRSGRLVLVATPQP